MCYWFISWFKVCCYFFFIRYNTNPFYIVVIFHNVIDSCIYFTIYYFVCWYMFFKSCIY